MAPIVDTNVMIDALNGVERAVEIFRRHKGEEVSTTVVNKYEFVRGLLSSKLSDIKKEEYTDFIDRFKLYELTSRSVGFCSDVYLKLKSNGRLINELDIIILGICVENNELLITSDRDFDRAGQLVGINVEFL